MSERPDVKSAILEEATRQFAARGFEGVRVADLAAAVGMRGPSLLHHFKTKEALRAAVLASLLDHWKDELPRVLAAAQSSADRFDGLLRAFLGFFEANPDRARLLLREVLDRPMVIRELLAAEIGPWTRILADILRAGQADGRIRPDLVPEAWVLQVITTGVGVIATHPTISWVFPACEAPALEVSLAELVRSARVSLFVPRPSGSGASHAELL